MSTHQNLAAGRWKTMSFVTQMANVGSEISRAFNWKNKGNHDYSLKAYHRALELLDLTIASAPSLSSVRELLRTREVLNDYFYGSNEFQSSETNLRKYFDHFAYASRRNS